MEYLLFFVGVFVAIGSLFEWERKQEYIKLFTGLIIIGIAVTISILT